MTDLSIIFVNYKSSELIISSIDAIVSGTSLSLEIIVVDNNSCDQAEIQILQRWPFVRFIQMSYNAGFARANNAGIEQAQSNTILLLNPDTISIGNSIDYCFERLNKSTYMVAGVQLLNPDGSPQITGNYFITGGLNHLLPLPNIGSFLLSVAKRLKVKSTNLAAATKPTEVDWLNGAFIMVKKSALQTAGLLDPDFFLYAEEIEWCSRLRKLGPLVLYGDLKFYHLQGATANEAFQSTGKGYYNLYDKKGLQILVSNFLRIRKQYGIGWFLLHLAAYTLELPVLMLTNMFRKLFGKNTYPDGLINGYKKNLGTLYSLVPKMISNKPYFYKML